MWTSAAELAALRERNRLARAMHDGLGHALVLVNVKLEAAERLYARDPAHGAAELEATRALVRATMADLSRSLTELREAPASSDLVAGLHTLAAEVTARGQLTVTADLPVLVELEPAACEALWLIAREAPTNVERHADATHAELRVSANATGRQLEVADNGRGIRPADLRKPGHFGLIGMRERAETLGGTLQITRNTTGGACVVVWLPTAPPVA